jgi:hypothetical protein
MAEGITRSGKTPESVCPVCHLVIAPAESVGNVEGTPAHLDCWIVWKRKPLASTPKPAPSAAKRDKKRDQRKRQA